jgi:hypothetical protein
MVIVSALRCLVAIKSSTEIPITIIEGFIRSRNLTVRIAALIAVAAIVNSGGEITQDMLDVFLARIDTVPAAATVLALASREQTSAAYIVNQLAGRVTEPPLELYLRILSAAVKHTELIPKVKSALDGIKLRDEGEKVQKALLILKGIVG